MNFWNESTTTVKALIVGGALVIVALLVALIASLSGGTEPDVPAVAVPTFTPSPVAAQLPAGPVLVATTAVNVRLGPSTDYPEVGTLQQNQTAPMVGRSEDGTWYAISFPTNVSEQGWVAAEYVTASEAESVPVIAAPPLPGQEATPATPPDAQPAPVAAITAPAEGQVGSPVVFSAEASTSASPLVRFAWAFGDGTVADAVAVEKTYDAPGVFLVNLVIVDEAGQEAQAQHRITIAPASDEAPPAEGGPIEIPDSLIAVTVDGQAATIQVVSGIPYFDARVGQTVRLDATAAQALYPTLEVVWDMGDGSAPVAGIAVEHQYAAAAVYEIAIAATDGVQSTTKLWQVGVAE